MPEQPLLHDDQVPERVSRPSASSRLDVIQVRSRDAPTARTAAIPTATSTARPRFDHRIAGRASPAKSRRRKDRRAASRHRNPSRATKSPTRAAPASPARRAGRATPRTASSAASNARRRPLPSSDSRTMTSPITGGPRTPTMLFRDVTENRIPRQANASVGRSAEREARHHQRSARPGDRTWPESADQRLAVRRRSAPASVLLTASSATIAAEHVMAARHLPPEHLAARARTGEHGLPRGVAVLAREDVAGHDAREQREPRDPGEARARRAGWRTPTSWTHRPNSESAGTDDCVLMKMREREGPHQTDGRGDPAGAPAPRSSRPRRGRRPRPRSGGVPWLRRRRRGDAHVVTCRSDLVGPFAPPAGSPPPDR